MRQRLVTMFLVKKRFIVIVILFNFVFVPQDIAVKNKMRLYGFSLFVKINFLQHDLSAKLQKLSDHENWYQ